MSEKASDATQGKALLEKVREGMQVYDRNGKKLGKVEWVQFGEGEPSGRGAAEPERGAGAPTTTTYVGDLGRGAAVPSGSAMSARAFESDDQLAPTVRNRLIMNGFVRVDRGLLFGGHRYILPEHIAEVSGDRVTLRVSAGELVKPG